LKKLFSFLTLYTEVSKIVKYIGSFAETERQLVGMVGDIRK